MKVVSVSPKEGFYMDKITHVSAEREIELASTYSTQSEVTTSPTDCFTSFLAGA
jgi:hypothetical protein